MTKLSNLEKNFELSSEKKLDLNSTNQEAIIAVEPRDHSSNGVSSKTKGIEKIQLIKPFFLGMILLFMVSCRTAYYVPSKVYDNKIPSLSPDIDWLSIETHFIDGTAQTSGTISGSGGFRANSTYIKNPQIKELRDIFTEETFKVSEQFGKQQGSIVWSVEYYLRDQKGAGASVALVAATAGTGGIFHLLGVPWCSYTGYFTIKADILDKDGNYIASYSAENKSKKYYVAMWWGYSGNTARKMAYYNPLYEALNGVKSKIINDREKITEQLNK